MKVALIKAYLSQFLKSMKDKELFVATLAVVIINFSLSSYNFAYEYIPYLLALGLTFFLIFGMLSYKRYVFLHAAEEADIESDEHLENLHDQTFYSAVFLSGTILLTVLALLFGKPLSREDVREGIEITSDTNTMVEYLLANSTSKLKQKEEKIKVLEAANDDAKKELKSALDALKRANVDDSEKRIPQAEKSLLKGNTAEAKAILSEVAEMFVAASLPSDEGRTGDERWGELGNATRDSRFSDILNVARLSHHENQAAMAYRHLGAIALLDNTQEAYDAYKRATELEPENPNGWNQLGHILNLKGETLEAQNAFLRVAEIGDSYYKGIGVKQDYAEAGKLYKKACDGGIELSCLSLGVYYAKGTASIKDIEEANLYREACIKEDREACKKIGVIYTEHFRKMKGL